MKTKISMIKYDSSGKPVDVALGYYKQKEVEIFRQDGFIDVEEGLAKKVDMELTENPSLPWDIK